MQSNLRLYFYTMILGVGFVIISAKYEGSNGPTAAALRFQLFHHEEDAILKTFSV